MAINEFENALQFCDHKKNQTWPVDLDSAIENLWQTKCDWIISKLRLLNLVAQILTSVLLDLKRDFFPFYIQNLSNYSRLKVLGVNRKQKLFF